MKNYLLLSFIALFFYSCINKKENNISFQVLPTFIHEGDSVTIYAIQDSIEIDTKELFFHITLIRQNFSHTQGYIKIKNGEGKFKVPKGTANISGFFYNLNQQIDKKTYQRLIFDKDKIPVFNAYSYELEANDDIIKKELSNHPDNFSVYANHIIGLSGQVYVGKISDSLLKETAQKHLLAIEDKIDIKSANHLYTSVVLYSNLRKFSKAKQALLQLLNHSPNSYFFHEAKSHFFYAKKDYDRNNAQNETNKLEVENPFLDSLNNYISVSYPNSHEGVWQTYIKRIPKNYTIENMVKNTYYQLNYKDSTDKNLIEKLVRLKLMDNDFDSARFIAKKYLQLTEEDIDEHYAMVLYRDGLPRDLEKGSYLESAYQLLAEVSEADGNLEEAINYLILGDSALQTDKNMFYSKRKKDNNFYKARLQRKNKQPAAALKTYSKLYQEVQDEQILDSIKVVFEEQDQMEGFDAYVENLKNQTKDKKEELKIVPQFSIKDTKGNLYTDKNLKDAVVVLNFWGVHCSPCVREIPVMNEFWEATQGHEIVYLAITRDKALATERFGRRQKEMFKFPVVATNQAFFDRFGVQLIPTQIIINPKGEIIYTQVGATKDATQNLKKVLEKELQIDNILIE